MPSFQSLMLWANSCGLQQYTFRVVIGMMESFRQMATGVDGSRTESQVTVLGVILGLAVEGWDCSAKRCYFNCWVLKLKYCTVFSSLPNLMLQQCPLNLFLYVASVHAVWRFWRGYVCYLRSSQQNWGWELGNDVNFPDFNIFSMVWVWLALRVTCYTILRTSTQPALAN